MLAKPGLPQSGADAVYLVLQIPVGQRREARGEDCGPIGLRAGIGANNLSQRLTSVSLVCTVVLRKVRHKCYGILQGHQDASYSIIL